MRTITRRDSYCESDWTGSDVSTGAREEYETPCFRETALFLQVNGEAARLRGEEPGHEEECLECLFYTSCH